jgi:hypothetical protein
VGGGEGGFDRVLVADVPVEANIAFGIVMDQGRAFGDGGADGGDGGEGFDVDDQGFGGVLGLFGGFGDDHGDGVTHVADLALGEDGVGRLDHRGAVLAVELPAAGDAAEAGFGDVFTGEDGDHARHGAGFGGVDRFQGAVRDVRAFEDGVGLTGAVDVVGVAAVAGEEAVVFGALGGIADAALDDHRI